MSAANSKKKKAVKARSPPPQRTNGSSTLFNVFARILAWYTLYTVLFCCPAAPTNDSPTICHTSHAISKALRPHVEPYYKAHVSPYVTRYSPYAKHTNDEYIIPVYELATSSYERFAAPHVTRGQEYVAKKYKRLVKPRVDQVSKKAKVYYDDYLSPHVATANLLYIAARPHLIKAGKSVEGFYKDVLYPSYERSLPFVITAYEKTRHVIVTIIAPLVKANGEKAVGWGIGVWSEVVRPQVGRIGERLGGTGNGVPAASVSASIFPSLSSTDIAKATASVESLSSIISSVAASAKASSQAAEANESKTSGIEAKKATEEEVREVIKADLENWKGRFDAATKQAAIELNTQIDEISIEAKDRQASHVKKEIHSLRKLIEEEFISLKRAAQDLAKPVDTQDEHHQQIAEETFASKSKETGVKIRDKAQSIRVESQQFLSNIYDDVAKAADANLETLDSVLNLAMQELGMKWAWMEYVTYKDWQKYHALKKDFDNFRRDVVVAAQKNRKLIEITRWTESDWEGKATEIAKEAAEELKRLKTVSKRKIQLSDSSDDFSESVLPAAQRVAQAIKESEEVLAAAEKLKSRASEEAQSVASTAIEKAKSAASAASSSAGRGLEDLALAGRSSLSDVVYGASTSTEKGSAERATGVAKSVTGEVGEAFEAV